MVIIEGIAYPDDDWRVLMHVQHQQTCATLRPAELMAFALNIDDLNVAVDILLFCSDKRTWLALLGEMLIAREQQLELDKVGEVTQFLVDHELLIRSGYGAGTAYFHGHATEYKNDYEREHDQSFVQAIPRAVDELVYRIAHDGQPSAPHVAERESAHERVAQALAAAGYVADKGIALRVVR